MEDSGIYIGFNMKLKKLQRKIDEALKLLKMDNPDIQQVIRILEGTKDNKK